MHAPICTVFLTAQDDCHKRKRICRRQQGYTGIDVILGMVPNQYARSAPGSDYFTWPIAGNLVAGCYQSGDSLFFRRFNYSNNTYDSRQLLATPTAEIDASGRKMIAASTDGQRIFVMWWVSTANSERLVGKFSTDGGNTFGSIVTVMQRGYTLGSDVMYPWFGDDLIFKPNSTNYGAAFCTQPAGNSFREFKYGCRCK
jgi:hypothetical protein